ncbi:MAG TPA: NADH-quinone oxidoreductase subunit L [Tepidisphaeraceae bacterium]|jgi:NADH-quinone oxidoreductase subunit L|nr:NADH-quinone oxidoreductase subunit L [Tepidisphaeraceae bacterium]
MDQLFPVQYSILIPLAPLLGAIIAGFFGAKWIKGQSHWPIWLGVGFSALLSICLMSEMLTRWHGGETLTAVKNYFTWIQAGKFVVQWGYFFDPLTAVMLCVVCGIGFFITVFAAGYMKGEAGYFRFFAYLGLFIFMMTNLVMGENLIMLYLGWEGVGLSSYLLIGYYYDKPSAREAAKKAFLVNRVGDFGFGLGIMLSFLTFGTISYFGHGVGSHSGLLELAAMPLDQLAKLPGVNVAWVPTAMKWIPFLLMVGAFGKSAQFPLYVWLPDAMEGPTPVSALIHAATMVTAGVYMIARCGTLFVGNAGAMMTIACVGAFTAVFAATIALRQFDLKKVFAYSTISQLGFMFVGVGVLAPVAGVFHLITHAFFKALLFLGSGVVMHAMSGELDMRKMSGLKKVLPKTHILMLIGCAALAGFPFTAGFLSKDQIVGAAWQHSKLLGSVMLFAALMTAYYTFRLYFRVFLGPLVVPPPPDGGHGHGHDDHGHGGSLHGAEDAEGAKAAEHEHHHNHEPAIMILPLIVLAIGALVAGYLNFPERDNSLAGFLGKSPSFALAYEVAEKAGSVVSPMPFGQLEAAKREEETNRDTVADEKHTELMLMWASSGISILGIYLAFVMHLKNRRRGEELPNKMPQLARLLEGKYWIDEIYQDAIVEPLRALGRVFFAIDRYVVDGIVWLISFIPQASGWALKLSTQRGYLQGYAATMLFGIAVILLIIFL